MGAVPIVHNGNMRLRTMLQSRVLRVFKIFRILKVLRLLKLVKLFG